MVGFVERNLFARLESRRWKMSVLAQAKNETDYAGRAGPTESFDLGFLPKSLTTQCQSLIESYHELHGYGCLPDILWKSRLRQFIEAHLELRRLLRKASTTRSAKKSNECFVRIASAILSLEILASSFSGWSTIYPDAGSIAQAVLLRHARSPHMPLMEFYLYPPKYISSAAIAALALPAGRRPGETELYRASLPQLSGEKLALSYVSAIRQASDGSLAHQAALNSVWSRLFKRRNAATWSQPRFVVLLGIAR
jgi:hypothetical protein